MGDLGPIKLIIGAGVVLTAFLMGVGMFASNEGERQRDHAREVRQERQEMFNMAMEQARQAQQMAQQHQMHMERMMYEAEYGGEYPQDFAAAAPAMHPGQ